MHLADVITLDGIEEIKNLLNTKTNTKIDAVKSVVDTINSNVNTINSNVATDNTASETGILSQKLSWLITVNKNHGSLEKTSAGNRDWTCPTGVYYVYVIACGGQGGGGGGGGGHYGNSPGRGESLSSSTGGGSGAVSEIVSALIPVTPGNVYAITVGAGGTGGTAGKKGNGYKDEYTTADNTAGGSGGTGGDTKFGSIFTVMGGSGGGGGKAARYNEGEPHGGTAGSVRNTISSTFRQIILYIISGVAGRNGATGTYKDDPSFPYAGSAGGSAMSNRLNLKSGAGGAGGRSGYANTGSSGGLDGSAGSAGDAGYIKIIW